MDNDIWLNSPDSSQRELKSAAYRLAQSTEEDSLRALYAGLQREDRLGKLDPQEDYLDYPATQLRLAGIFRHLMQNQSPASDQLLVALTREATFRDVDARREILVKALAVVRPAPPEAIQYWQAHAAPGSIFLHFVIEALCRNGSPPAIQLLETIFTSGDYSEQMKVLWMRDPVLRHRNDESLLTMCGRLLVSPLSPDLKVVMVMALIDHDPEVWYPPDHLPKPPPRSQASDTAKQALLSILKQAGQMREMTVDQKLLIDAVAEEIGGIETAAR